MKKYLLSLMVMIFGIILLVGCTSRSQSNKDSQQVSLTDNLQLSLDDAIKIYQKEYPNSDITSIELEKSLNRRIYRIEGVDDDKEYQANINTDNSKIIHQRTEQLDRDERNGQKRAEKINLEKLITIKKIAHIAEKEVSNGKAVEFSLEQDLGVTYWEVAVKNNSTEKEVKVDAQKGTVLSVDKD